MRKNAVPVILMILLLAVAALPAASISRPAATVRLIRNTAITMDQLESEYSRYVAMGAPVTRMDVLDTLINDEVFLQGAERDGVTISDRQIEQLYQQQKANVQAQAMQAGQTVTDAAFEAEVMNQFGSVDEYKKALGEQYIVNQYLMLKRGNELQNVPMPTDAEVNSFYRQNQQAFFQAENVKLAHIYIPKNGNATEDEASLRLLTDVAADIHSGAITFEKAVSEYSQDEGSRNVGGDIGWLSADNTAARQGWGNAFCDEVLSMEPGQVSDVLESDMGYHIVRVSVHNAAKILSLSDPVSPAEIMTVREYIQQYLYMVNSQNTVNAALQSLILELRNEAQINIIYQEQ